MVALDVHTPEVQDVGELLRVFLARDAAQRATMYQSPDTESQEAAESPPVASAVTPENVVPFQSRADSAVADDAEDVEDIDAVSDAEYQRQLTQLQKLNGLFFEQKIDRQQWEEGLGRFAPNVDPMQAELLLGQYVAQRREGSGWE